MRTSLCIIICVLFSVELIAQPRYRVSRCEDLGLNPENTDTGEKLLAIYLEGNDDGIGGHGCWVHHHENGKDYVVTPHSWGSIPPPGKKGLIDDAMQAITDSRAKYETLGDLSNHLYYILDDINRTSIEPDGSVSATSGEAFWLLGEECWMQSGAPTLRSGEGLSTDRGDRKQTFAHEIGHCFVMKNVSNLDRYYDLNHWFDESVSEYLSSLVYPSGDQEHDFSRIYDLDGEAFQQEYNANVLWYYYSKRKGISAVVPLMNRLAAYGTRTDRLKYLRNTGFDELYHQFLSDYYKSQIQDAGGTGAIPREEAIVLRQPGEDLITDPAPPIAINSIPSERLSLYELYVPADYDLIIKPPINSSEKAFFSLISDKRNVRDWNAPETIEGNCGSFTVVNIMASHLQDDPVTGTKITYQLVEREGCCEEALTVDINPDENELNGKFEFDHYIESYVNYKADGDAESLPLNYYVNSKDGSMLLPESWFTTAFGTDSSDGMDAEAVIWLANGQVVAYVNDMDFGQKRAITLDLNQTRGDILGIRALRVAELLSEGRRSGMTPAPLPAGSIWNGRATGLAYESPEMSETSQLNKVSAYISLASTPITSPLPSFGFMVGYIKDWNNQNKKLVYSRFDMPDGDMFEVHLESIEKKCFAFNGAGYKKMTLGASTGAIAAMSMAEQGAFVEGQTQLQEQKMMLIEEMARCNGNKTCEADVTRRLMELERQQQNSIHDLPGNPDYTGTAATEFQDDQKAIQEEMYALGENILAKEIHCDRLERQNTSCGGCMTMIVERCITQYEELLSEMRDLECKMARLHGTGDMMEDCH